MIAKAICKMETHIEQNLPIIALCQFTECQAKSRLLCNLCHRDFHKQCQLQYVGEEELRNQIKQKFNNLKSEEILQEILKFNDLTTIIMKSLLQLQQSIQQYSKSIFQEVINGGFQKTINGAFTEELWLFSNDILQGNNQAFNQIAEMTSRMKITEINDVFSKFQEQFNNFNFQDIQNDSFIQAKSVPPMSDKQPNSLIEFEIQKQLSENAQKTSLSLKEIANLTEVFSGMKLQLEQIDAGQTQALIHIKEDQLAHHQGQIKKLDNIQEQFTVISKLNETSASEQSDIPQKIFDQQLKSQQELMTKLANILEQVNNQKNQNQQQIQISQAIQSQTSNTNLQFDQQLKQQQEITTKLANIIEQVNNQKNQNQQQIQILQAIQSQTSNTNSQSTKIDEVLNQLNWIKCQKSLPIQQKYWFSPTLKGPSIQVFNQYLAQNNSASQQIGIFEQMLLKYSVRYLDQIYNSVIKFKIQSSGNSWMGLGICDKKIVVSKNFVQDPGWGSTGHGCYMLRNDGYFSSNTKGGAGNGFSYVTNNIIMMQVNMAAKQILFTRTDTQAQSTMDFDPNADLHPAVLFSSNCQVQIIE